MNGGKKMKFVVLNGSPKGNELSATMQFIYYLQKVVPGHDFEIFTVSKDIKRIENDHAYFNQILRSIRKCDAVLWSMPVFILLVPSQQKRFIELVFEKNKQKSFAGKYSTAFFTSAMVFDHTAHNYIHGISEDLGMKFIKGFSALTQALEKKECQDSVKNFFLHFIASVENREQIPKAYFPISWKPVPYKAPAMKKQKKKRDKKILLLTDHEPGSNLEQMVKTYQASSRYAAEVQNIRDLNIKGPCLDCLKCAFTGVCVYVDEMRAFYDEKILPADAIVFAGTLVDRYISSTWKKFLDRSFFNGHRPILNGKYAAMLFSGPLRQIPNFLQAFESQFSYAQMEVVGSATDEEKTNTTTTGSIKHIAASIDRRLEIGGVRQQNFLARGTHLVLRDTIFRASPILNEDHRYFKKEGLYDFPQNWNRDKAMKMMLQAFMLFPFTREMIKRDILKFMVMPAQKAVEKARP
jgi:multimeric flavodoxin WrbA